MTAARKRNVLSTFFATEWAMEPEYLRWMTALTLELCALTSSERASRLRALEAQRGEPLDYAWNTTIRDGVAIIPITGPIAPEMDYFTYYSGGTSMSRLAVDFNAVLEDPRVVAILFKVKSPGGAVDDVSPMARMIFEARGRKPMAVHVGGQCCSAAYWLAAAAGDIECDDTSRVGSIGVYSAYLDTSKYDAKNGFREVVFRSSQSPKKNLDPTTKGGADEVQMTLDALGQVFVEAVAEYRGVDLDKVLTDFGQGGVRVGRAALDAGLVDGVRSFEEVLAELAGHNKTGGGGFNGTVVRGQVVSAEEARERAEEDEDDACPDHPDEDCPDDCPYFVPDDDDEEAGDKTSARERRNQPAPTVPATLNEGAESMSKEQDPKGTTKPGEGGQTQANDDRDLRARLEAAEKAAAESAREAEETRKRLAAVERRERDARFGSLAKDWAGERATHLQMLEHLASQEGGEEGALFKAYVTQQDATAEQLRSGKLFAELGRAGVPEGDANTPAGADARLTARAKEIAREKGITFEKAYVEACREKPELAEVANVTVE